MVENGIPQSGFFRGERVFNKKKKKAVCFSEGTGAEMRITVVLKSSTSENEVCVCIDAATHPGRKRLGNSISVKISRVLFCPRFLIRM